MKKILLPLLLLAGFHSYAQENASARFAGAISIPELKKHLTVIAGEDMEGRETGTEGQRKAAAYIEAHFKNLGLTYPPALGGFQQAYPLHQDTLLASSLTIGKITGRYGLDFISPAGANDNSEIKSKSVVFAGYGIEDKNYDSYAGLDVKGKIVLIVLGEPKSDGKYLVSGTGKTSDWTYPGLSKKIELAASKGAVAVFVINPSTDSIATKTAELSKKTNVYYPRDTKNKKVNYAVLSHAFAASVFGQPIDTIIKTSKAGGLFSKEVAFESKQKSVFTVSKKQNIIKATNVLGVLEGTDKKDEYVFITAHYDHLGKRDGKIYYGADDDGSGTVAVMQLASAFMKAKEEGKGPRRNIVFMTVSGEEKGLWGSEYYSDHPVFPLEKTSVDLNIDMIGRIDTERMKEDTLNYVYVVGHDKISTDLPVINEGMNHRYTQLTLDYKFDDPNDPNRIYYRSDHYNFARKGVPVLFFYDGMLKADYHKPTDTVDKINWDLYQKRAQMIFHTAWEMANREQMLVRDLPIPTGTR